MKKSKVLSFKYFLFDFIRVTAAIPGLLWFRPKKIYINKNAKKLIKGGALIISNHIGLIDPMYLLLAVWSRRLHLVASKELSSNKFTAFLFKYAFLTVSIDRQNFSLKTFKEITGLLSSGNVVAMFPEGHVNENNEGVNSFKSGMILMALKSGAPIIPVYIKRPKHWYSRLTVCFGEHIDVKEICPTSADKDKAAEYLHLKEVELENFTENEGKK